MATQAINNVVNVAIDTVADFTAAAPGGGAGIDDTKLSNGWRCLGGILGAAILGM